MTNKKGNWRLIYKGDPNDFDPLISYHYWKSKSPMEKFAEVTSLIEQALEIKGKSISDASRLLRSTALLKRI